MHLGGDILSELSTEALELRRAYNRQYQREYVKKNRDKVNQRAKDYRTKHPDRIKATQAKYWEKKARELSQE